MGYNFKEVMNKPERFAPGHRMCAGCGATICCKKRASWTSRRRQGCYWLCNRMS